MCKRLLLALAVVLACAAGVEAQTVVKLCTAVGTGCTATATMSNLNNEVATAAALSTPTVIYIENGATLNGTLILRHRAIGVTALVTIRSGVDAAGNLTSSSIWPDATTRLWPPSYTGVTTYSGHATNYTGALAKLIASGTNESTVQTIEPSGCAAAPLCVAHHYKLELLDISAPFLPTSAGGVIVALGSQNIASETPGNNSQNLAAEEPHDITLSQVYIHGTDAQGAIHAVMHAAKDVTIQHSYIGNIWWPGSDTQAVWTINTTGGLTLTNNYLESSGENYLAGGDQPRMVFSGVTLSASSTTSATLTAALADYMRVGDCVAVLVGGAKSHACISSIDPSGGNPRRLITFSPALATAPDVPGSMSGNVVPRGFSVTGNWFNIPLAWRGTSKGAGAKNLFEIKNGRDYMITGNLFTNLWQGSQNGTALVITPANQNGSEDSTHVKNVAFSYNRVQHVAGCIGITGTNADYNYFSQRTENISFTHLSCDDVSVVTYGIPDYIPVIQLGVGGHTPVRMYPTNVSFDHIYVDSRANSAHFQMSSDANTSGAVAATIKSSGLTIKNSIFRIPGAPPNGFISIDDVASPADGLASWNATVTGGICQNNSWARENASVFTFCTGSHFPTTLAEQDGALVSYGTDYSVDQGCGAASATCYDNAATDGSDLGPNWAILSDYMADALAGTPGGGEEPPPDPDPTPPNYEELTINKIYSPTATNLVMESAGDLVLNPIGKDVIPGAGYDINLGRQNRKFASLNVAEAFFSTLVTVDNISTVGGRFTVAPSTVLTSDLAAGDTTIATKHANLNNGDRLWLEEGGQFEVMGVTSSASGAGPFTYSVNRGLNPLGPRDWSAGDAIVNTGTTGNGFFDIYSTRGMKASSEIGPTMVANVRTGSGYISWEPRAAFGNLDGLYGYNGPTFGAAFGMQSGARLTITPDDGIRIYGSDNGLKLDIDASGNATFDGRVTIGTSRNMISNSECRNSTEGWSLSHNTGLTVSFGFGYEGWRLLGESNTCYLHGYDFVPAAGTFMQAIGESYAASAGQVYEASVYLGMHRTAGTMFLQFLDEANGIVGSFTGNTCFESNGNGGPLLAGYCRSYLVATAPVGTAKVRVFIRSTMLSTTDDNPYMFFVRAYLGEGKPGQTQVSEWGPSGLTEITNGMIRTNAITSRTIDALAITTEKLAASAITADKIQFGVITGDHIVANSIRAENIGVTELSAITANLGTVNTGTLNAVNITGSSTINIGGGLFTVNTSGWVQTANLTTGGYIFASGEISAGLLASPGLGGTGERLVCANALGHLVVGNGSSCGWAVPPAPAPAAARLDELERRIAELEAALKAAERKQ